LIPFRPAITPTPVPRVAAAPTPAPVLPAGPTPAAGNWPLGAPPGSEAASQTLRDVAVAQAAQGPLTRAQYNELTGPSTSTEGLASVSPEASALSPIDTGMAPMGTDYLGRFVPTGAEMAVPTEVGGPQAANLAYQTASPAIMSYVDTRA